MFMPETDPEKPVPSQQDLKAIRTHLAQSQATTDPNPQAAGEANIAALTAQISSFYARLEREFNDGTLTPAGVYDAVTTELQGFPPADRDEVK